jgi:hypothetical protein
MQATNSTPSSPLESLLVHQLEQLIARERILEHEYLTLATKPNDHAPRAKFAAELSQLERRADRLWRMIDAMN